MIDRVTNRTLYRRSPPSLFPTQKEPMGATVVVGFWKHCECSFDYDLVQVDRR